MRKLQASDDVVYRTLQAPKISGKIPEFFWKNSGIFQIFYFSGKVTTLMRSTCHEGGL